MTVFVVIMLPIVVGLGFWQLNRAEYKSELEAAYFDQLGGLPSAVAEGELPADFSRVRLTGHWRDEHWLLDNQVNSGVPGYWVYTPFTTRRRTWLVNRGWTVGPRLRSDWPDIAAPPAGEQTIVALVWPDTGMLPLFGSQATLERRGRLRVMQRLAFAGPDMAAMQPIELRLEPGEPGVLVAAPQAIGFGIERHRAYAAQWFGLAVALLAGFWFFGRRTQD